MRVRPSNALLFTAVLIIFSLLFVLPVSELSAQQRLNNIGVDDITVTVEDADGIPVAAPGPVEPGYVVTVVLDDPDPFVEGLRVDNAWVNFTGFEGPVDVVMTQDPVILNLWTAEYTVLYGSTEANDVQIIVKVENTTSEAERNINKPSGFDVDNRFDPVGANIVITLTDPDPFDPNLMVPGTIVNLVVIDPNFGDPVLGLTAVTANLSCIGGPAGFILSDDDNDGTWEGQYEIQYGNIVDTDICIAFSVTNSTGTSVIAKQTIYDINNTPDPFTEDIIDVDYIVINGDPALDTMKIGDYLTLHIEFDLTRSAVVDSITIDWGATFNGGEIVTYEVDGNIFEVTYYPEEGSLTYTPGLFIAIESVKDQWENVSPFSPYLVSGNEAGDPIVADLVAPSYDDLIGGEDLWYDYPDGYLRFSPDSPVVAGYDTDPDFLIFYLTIPDWGEPGGPYAFGLRIEFEGRTIEYRTFTDGIEVDNNGGDLTVVWDGRNDAGDLLDEGTWGLTLWNIYDEVGNSLHLGNNYVITGEHPTYPSQLSDGYVILNRMHVVIDNTPPEFADEVEVTNIEDDPIVFTRRIYDYDVIGDDLDPTEQAVRYKNNISDAEMAFRIRRDFRVDSNDLRMEQARYWMILENLDDNTRWYWDGNDWQDIAGFDLNDIPFDPALFPTPFAQNSYLIEFNWDITPTIPGGFKFAGSEDGIDYRIDVFIQDDAGNIEISEPLTFTIEEEYYDVDTPFITAIELLTEHTSALPVADGFGIKNFYLSTDYYTSINEIEIEFEVNDKDYLRETNSMYLALDVFGVDEGLWINRDEFDDDNKWVYSITVDGLPETMEGLWTFGDPNQGIRVVGAWVYTDYVIPGEDDDEFDEFEAEATMNIQFNLVIPPEPVWPELDDAELTIDDEYISPGHPSFTYNSVTNPAKDGIKDNTQIHIHVPLSSEPLQWDLTVTNPVNNRVRTWGGDPAGLLPANQDHSESFIFHGLDDNLAVMVGAVEEQELEVKLRVVNTPHADVGYHDPPAPLTVIQSLFVDNVKPELVSGDGVVITGTYDIELDVTPVVSGLDRVIYLTLYTSEPLRTDNLNEIGSLDPAFFEPGWNALVVDDDGAPIFNDVHQVLAEVLDVTDVSSNGVYAYDLEIEITGTSGDFEFQNATLVVRLPWDEAGNPGRYNDPSYPFGEDVFHNDSSEGYLKFHILNARPDIAEIKYEQHKSVGIADFIDPAQDEQGFMSEGEFTLTAKIVGGAYYDIRSIETSFKADLSPVLGAGNEAVTPTEVQEVTTRTENEERVFLVIWEAEIDSDQDPPFYENFDHLDEIELHIFVETEWDDDIVHETEAFITIIKDVHSPVVVEAFETVVTGISTVEYTLTDDGAGIDWDSALLEIDDVDIVINNRVIDEVEGTVSWDLDIPLDTESQNLIFTMTVMDNVENETVDVRYINVLPTPVVYDVIINDGFDYFKPGTDVEVFFSLEHFERVEEIKVVITTPAAFSEEIILDNTTVFVEDMSVVFENVVIPHLHVLTATVTAYTMHYADSQDITSLQLIEVSSDEDDVIADHVEPDIVAEGNVSELNTLAPQYLLYTITDDDAGVDWDTAVLVFNPDSPDITVGAPELLPDDQIRWEVSVLEETELQMVEAIVTVDDNVANTASLTRYLNIRPLPVISNVLIQDVTQAPANPDWWVPGHAHELEVTFEVENHQRVNQITVDLIVDGDVIASKDIDAIDIFAFNSISFFDEDIFDLRLLAPGSLDGEIITALVSGITESYESPDSDIVVVTDLNTDEDTINVDTEPVTTDVVFLLNGDVINTLLPDMTDLEVVVTVKAPNDVVEPVLTLEDVTGGFAFDNVTVADFFDVDDNDTRYQIFTYHGFSVSDLGYDVDELFAIASFKVNTQTIYGYLAEERTHQMVVIGYPVHEHYGVLASGRTFDDIGRTPAGWFAPEHDFITEYGFISTVDAGVAPIIADFDLIMDNVPENWRAPDTTDRTVIPVSLLQGGDVISFDIYHYLAGWVTEPDYQSVWSAYDDGEAIQIDYVYQQFTGDIIDFNFVRVDKEVPTYDKSMYSVALAMNDDAPAYQDIPSDGAPGTFAYKTISLPLTPPYPGVFEEDTHLYVKVRAKDIDPSSPYPGVGVGWIQPPVVTGWTVEEHNNYTDNGFFYQEWKLTPVDYSQINEDDLSQLVLQLSEVEDLAGHKNYDGSDNPHSNLYSPVAPTITFNFTSGSSDGMFSYIRAYQKLPGDPLNELTSPYIRPGANLGLRLELTQVQNRAAEVVSIEPMLVQINTPRADPAADDNWTDLVRVDPLDDFAWYLDADIPVTPEPDDTILGLNYKITYLITYSDATTEQATFQSAFISNYQEDGINYDLIVIDRTSPQFIQDGVLVKSAAYPTVSDNYVIPGYETEITVTFTEESNYYYDDTKPAVVIYDMDSFIDGVGAVYNVDPDDINYDDVENVWVAHITQLMATADPGITSQIITVTLADPVGNDPTTATKFVEIANDGPIVPLIKDAKLITNLWDNTPVEDYLVKVPAGQVVPSRIEIYIDTAYSEYIDEVSVDPVAGIDIDFNQIRPADAGEAGQWVAVFDVVATEALAGDIGDEIDFTVRTKREPYGQQIFNQSWTFATVIDGDIYNADYPFVQGIGVEPIDYIINPDLPMIVQVEVHDIGELVVEDALPANNILAGWFGLHNIAPDLLDELLIPDAVVTGDGFSRTVTWDIPADAINALDLQSSLRITYKNIYGLEKFVDVDFYIDTVPPVIAQDGIHFVDNGLVAEFSYDNNDPISISEDWTSLKVYLTDPEIIAGVEGSGLHYGKLQLVPRPATYQETPQMQALAAYFTEDIITDVDGNQYLEILLEDVMAGFTSYDLAIGLYDIIVETHDKLNNEETYTQPFYYDPAETSITLAPFANGEFSIITSEESKLLHALVNDPTGTVNGVHFRLYYDADAEGDYTPGVDPEYTDWDILPSVGGNPDMIPPFQAEWMFTNRDRYNWVPDPAYDEQDIDGNWIVEATRQFLLRVTAISQSRYITDHFQVVEVTDDVPPVPEEPTFDYHDPGNMIGDAIIYDYVNPDNNWLTLHTNFVDWPDARQARFEITKLGVMGDQTVIYSDEIDDPAEPISVIWDFATRNDATGIYEVAVRGIDWVGNMTAPEDAVLMTLNIEIINPASHVEYEMMLHNIISYTNQPVIPDGTIYGGPASVNPISNIINLRLGAAFNNLNGIERIRFMVERIDNVTGASEHLVVPNNPDYQIDYDIDAEGWISADQIVVHDPVDPTAYIFVPEDFYETLDEEDITYRFYVELESTNPTEDVLFEDSAQITIDNRAPQLAITSFTEPMMSWAQPGDFIVDGIIPDYDINDVDVLWLEWRLADGDDWNVAVWNNIVDPTIDDFYYLFEAWNIAGGSIETFLGDNFEGEVQMRVVAVDLMGNQSASEVVLPYVDNNAPHTYFTHVIHSVDYPQLTALSDQDTIHVATSTMSGSSNLHLFVDHTTLSDDAVMPLMMYHGRPVGADLVWQPVAYDHEHWNLGNPAYPSMYEFFIPSHMLDVGTHYFAVVTRDVMGNLEGDTASEIHAYTNTLSDAEKMGAVNLTVEVYSIDDIIATVEYPADMSYISGVKALTAETTDNDAVEYVRFEHNNGGTWEELAVIAKDQTHELNFELLRSDIPQFDGLPWVPGVHLFANGIELAEMIWDSAAQAWYAFDVELVAGVAYNFQYGIDINNNGIYDPGEPLIDCPKGFTHLLVTPWVYSFDSTQFAQGLHEVRAVPLDVDQDELPYYQSPSTWLIIDNVPPVINSITAVGNIQAVTPGEVVPFVTDINELLVATDDIVEVTYQYSGQPEGSINRQWIAFANSNVMAGNYPVNWIAVNPLIDEIDNNNNGLVDDPTEADAWFYIRAIASDRAGNYVTSEEYEIFVDGSPAKMVLTKINDVVLSDTNYIFNIPADATEIVLWAEDITEPIFDPAYTAIFEYRYRLGHLLPWTDWEEIDADVDMDNGMASISFDDIHEAYYQFRVYGIDALGNEDPNPTIVSVIFNDVTGPEITFLEVGTRPVISEEFAFANDVTLFEGNLTIMVDDFEDVNTVTFEYSPTGTDPWFNITTTDNIPANGIVTVPWNYPNLRSPLLYLRAIAQDNNANNMSTEVVKLYYDTVAPSIEVISLTHEIVDVDKKVLDKTEIIELEIEYGNLIEDVILDVASITVKLVGTPDEAALPLHTFTNVNEAETSFIFEVADIAALSDGIYHLEFEVTDFAGNVAVIIPDDYDQLYIDTTPPAGLVITAPEHPNNVAVYNETIEFRVDYVDLIGVPEDGAFTATFTYQNVAQEVDEYVLVEDQGETFILFDWSPSAEFQQFIIDGLMNLLVSVEVSVTDFLDQEGILIANNFFTLTYGVPANVRMMVIKDVVNDNDRINYVNWNLTVPGIEDMLGTNRTPGANAEPLTLYAYVPHLAEIPESITFQYKMVGDLDWTDIETVFFGDQWNFVDPSFLAQYARQYSAEWHIVDLPAGEYEIKTISQYPVSTSESIITIDIYDGIADDVLIPEIAVNTDNGFVQRGETYEVASPSFAGMDEFLTHVVYQYRYVEIDPADNIIPVSQWMYFGDQNGTEQDAWIPEPYVFDWTVYPYYLYNNRVQIVGFAKDQWGTETPITKIINSGNFVIAQIIDTIAPEIHDITVTWNGVENPEWLSGLIDDAATVKARITTNIMPNDINYIEFYFDNELIGTYHPTVGLDELWTDEFGFAVPEDAVDSGIIRVVAKDVYNNVNEEILVINIDNELPEVDLLVTTPAGVPVETLERGTTVILDAQATDQPSGVAEVAYFYRNELDPVWIHIDTVDQDPFSIEWDIPADLVYGDTYLIQAVVTDLVGHIAEDEVEFIVSDADTDIVIVSVAGHVPVNGIIPVRLHGDLPFVTEVNSPEIPRVEYLIRPVEATEWTSVEIVNVAGNNANALLNFNEEDSGDYYIGVRPREADRTLAEIVDIVRIRVDNDLNINIAGSEPVSGTPFNGEMFVVAFTVLDDIHGDTDYIDVDNVELLYEYIEPYDGTWYSLGAANPLEVTTLDGINWIVTFRNIDIQHNNITNDGIYNFSLRVRDTALPEANVAEFAVADNVIFDTTDPNVAITAINGIDDFAQPVHIPLGTNALIEVEAHDILAGQIVQVASGIDRVEFYYQFGAHVIHIGTDEAAPYEMNWNTLGYQTGDYTIIVEAFDNAGNSTVVVQDVAVVAPDELQPYAIITAMNFDPENTNQDHIYAVTNAWGGENIDGVAFEYTINGTDWLEFAQAEQIGNYWRAQFNAELMVGVTTIRPVVTYNGIMISSIKPELAVSYHAGGILETDPTIDVELYFDKKINVFNTAHTPIVTTLFDGAFVNMPAVQVVNGDFEAVYHVDEHGLYTFWAAVLDNDGNIQLAKNTLETFNIGTVADLDEVISVTIPDGAGYFVYFQDLKNQLAIPEGLSLLSEQKSVTAVPVQDMVYTMQIDTPADQGTVVGMYYDGDMWHLVPALVDGMTATFEAESGHIYAVGQFTDVVIEAMFVSVDPQFVHPVTNDTWTLEDTEITFFVYDGINQGGYETPLFGEFEYQLYINDLLVLDNVEANYNDGFITYQANGLAHGEHLARVVVTKDGFVDIAEKVFFVETTEPVIIATGSQITISDRTIEAQIVDNDTGISNVTLLIDGIMEVPFQNLTVNGDTYSYELTLEDLFHLGYINIGVTPMTVVWTAENNMGLATDDYEVNYTVLIEGPSIAFTGFENGWWINPTAATPLTFDVVVPDGRIMPVNGVNVTLVEVTQSDPTDPGDNIENIIQVMNLAPISVDGNVYSYSLNIGYNISPQAIAVRLEVAATDNYGAFNFSEQTYGTDYLPPIVWALSPVGEIIDPEDHPPVYESAILNYGTDVAIGVAYEDIPGFVVLETGEWWWEVNFPGWYYYEYMVYYTNASGIDAANVTVYLNGQNIENIPGAVVDITSGTYVANVGVLDPGEYNVIASVADNAGNVGSVSYSFTVVGGAPTITFNPLDNGGWWLNSTDDNTLTFEIDSQNQLASGGVVANIYTVPSGELIQGPITPTPDNNEYSIVLQGGVIPSSQTGVRLEVTATDVWDGTSTANQVYGIDNYPPQITIHTPVDGSEVVINSQVNITATINDSAASVRGGFSLSGRDTRESSNIARDRAGSGLDVITWKVIGPNDYHETGTISGDAVPVLVISESVTAAEYGTYQVTVTAKDIAGNESVANSYFSVGAPIPTITFDDELEWLNTTSNNTLRFMVRSAAMINDGGVIANIYTIPSNELLVGPITPMSVDHDIVGGVYYYEYEVVLQGGIVPANQTGVKLEVTATNILNGTATSNQIFGIDNIPPQITIQSPQPDAQFAVNSTINIIASISDLAPVRSGDRRASLRDTNIANRADDRAGSGIAGATLKVVTATGAIVVDESYPENTQVISHSLLVDTYGSYSVYVWAEDNAGNQSLADVSFQVVTTDAPTIDFVNDIDWIVNNANNLLQFNIASDVNTTVTAKVYAMPSDEIILGPSTLNPVGGLYTVNVHGSIIPDRSTAIKLEVTATDSYGLVNVSSNMYSVDQTPPLVTLFTPETGTELMLIDGLQVNVHAEFERSGSQIASAQLRLTDPYGAVSTIAATGEGVTEITAAVDVQVIGGYTVRLNVTDKAGNSVSQSTSFVVRETPLPPEVLAIGEAFIYPNPMDTDRGATFRIELSSSADLTIRIYDFANHEVRQINKYADAGRADFVEVAWDGRSDNGQRLARGTYFARIIANDGKKIVEKVVKVAIIK